MLFSIPSRHKPRRRPGLSRQVLLAALASIFLASPILAQNVVRIFDAEVVEKDNGLNQLQFDLQLDRVNSDTVSVTWQTENDTATAPDDFEAESGVVTFNQNQTSAFVNVKVFGDDLPEGDEIFRVRLTDAVNAVIDSNAGVATGTIIDDDPDTGVDPPEVQIDDVSILEGNSGTTRVEVSFRLSKASDDQVGFSFSTDDGTATAADGDYKPISGQTTLAAGLTVGSVPIDINGDTDFEPDESFFLRLSSPVGVTLPDTEARITIQNDDQGTLPQLTVSDAQIEEGDSGTREVSIVVTVDPPPPTGASFSFATEDGSATLADGDYLETIGNVDLGSNDAQATLFFRVQGDTKVEGDEVFRVRISNPVGVDIVDDLAEITITNDDQSATDEPALSISDVTVDEGNSGTTQANLTISLSKAADTQVTVQYATTDGTATLDDSDYVKAEGTVTIPAGQLQAEVGVTVNGDTDPEPNEVFRVVLTNPSGATLSDDSGDVTIRNDDTGSDELPALSISDVTVDEGDSGTTPARFTLTMDKASDTAVSVSWSTEDGSATVADSDYQQSNGTVTIGPGQTQANFEVIVNGDLDVEPNERFRVRLSNPSGVTLADDLGEVIIRNDDQAQTATPDLSIADLSVAEGDDGTTTAQVQVSLSQASESAVTLDFATADGSATTADGDYQQGSGSLSIAAGQTEAQISVSIQGDLKVEPDEFFEVRLSNVNGANATDSEARVTIRNDDEPEPEEARLSLEDASIEEGDDGQTRVLLTLRRRGPADPEVTVNWATEDGTAVAGEDYVSSSGIATFVSGQDRLDIELAVLGDTAPEQDEEFFVRLSSPSQGSLERDLGVVSILNDDEPPALMPRIGISSVSAAEGDAGSSTRLTLAVTLSEASSETVTVDFASEDGTATLADGDYQQSSGTASFGPGQVQVTIGVVVLGDDEPEADEVFRIRLSNPVGGHIGNALGEIEIVDDDATAGGGGGDPTPDDPEPIQTQVTRLTGNAGDVIELMASVTDASGNPVANAVVDWSGGLPLLDGATTRTDSSGMTRQRVRLSATPGEYEVLALAEESRKAFRFEIMINGSTESLFDEEQEPNQVAVARAFDRACAGARGELSNTCDFVFGLSEADQREVLDNATPLAVDTQASATLGAASGQQQNVAARTAVLRATGGAAPAGQVNVSIRGESLSIPTLFDAVAQSKRRFDPEAAVDSALDKLRHRALSAASPLEPAGQNSVGTDPEVDKARRLGFFINGNISFGESPETSRETGYDFETRGVTTGLDYRFGGGSFVGLAVGYIDSDNDAFGNLGGTTTQGMSATLYSTWQHKNFFLDASLAAGELDLELERVILLPQPLNGQSQLVATGDTESEYVTATLGVGYDFNLKRNGLTGFLRANATEADVNGFSESGAGGFNLVIRDQTAESLLAEAGFEWVRPFSYSWGVFQPVLRLSYFHEFDNDARAVTGRFALDATGSQFVILTEDPDRDFLTAGAGFTLTLKRNKSLFLLYETDLERDDLDVSKISFGARFQF